MLACRIHAKDDLRIEAYEQQRFGAVVQPSEGEVADYFARWNHDVVGSSRFNLTFEDGRNFLLTSPATYDVITLESIHPKWDAGNASLYSREFYRLCKSRLNPSGFISQWAPLNGMTLQEFKTILRTFSEAFPHASLWFAQPTSYLAATNAILLGSQAPLAIDTERLRAAFFLSMAGLECEPPRPLPHMALSHRPDDWMVRAFAWIWRGRPEPAWS